MIDMIKYKVLVLEMFSKCVMKIEVILNGLNIFLPTSCNWKHLLNFEMKLGN